MSETPVSTWTVPGPGGDAAVRRLAVLLAGICQMSRGDAGRLALLVAERGRTEFVTDTVVAVPALPDWAAEAAGRRRWAAEPGRRGYALHLMEARR